MSTNWPTTCTLKHNSQIKRLCSSRACWLFCPVRQQGLAQQPLYWKGCSIVWHYNGGLPTEKSNCINFRRDFRRSLISSQLWGSFLSSRFRFNCLTNTALRTAFCFWNPIVPLREKILFTTLIIIIVKSFDVLHVDVLTCYMLV